MLCINIFIANCFSYISTHKHSELEHDNLEGKAFICCVLTSVFRLGFGPTHPPGHGVLRVPSVLVKSLYCDLDHLPPIIAEPFLMSHIYLIVK
jgi:hypothetical protein